MRAMSRQAYLLLLPLFVVAAVAQIEEESYPTGFHRGYTELGRCRRIKSPGQRRRMPTAVAATPNLEEHPPYAATKTQNPESTFYRRERCPDGFVCLKGRCRKKLVVGCRDGYVMKRGRCRKMQTLGQPSRMTTTTAATPTWEEEEVITTTALYFPTRCRDGYIMAGGRCRRMWAFGRRSRMATTTAGTPTLDEGTSTTGATTPTPTGTLMYLPTRCRDGYVMVGGQCRRMMELDQQSWMTPTTEPVPTSEPSTTEGRQETLIYSRERCRDGYVYVRGRCRRVLNVREARLADSQPTDEADKDLQVPVSASEPLKPL